MGMNRSIYWELATYLRKRAKGLLLITIITTTMMSCVLFSVICLSSSNPSALNSRLAERRRIQMVRKAITPSITTLHEPARSRQIVTVKEHYQYVANKSLHIIHSPVRQLFDDRQLNISVFNSWSKGVITQISPSLHHNCSKLMAGNVTETNRVVRILNQTDILYTSTFENVTNCDQVMQEFLDNFYVSERERSFPIAFVLVVHKNAQQILRFLKAIYRSHNLYCIHPDLKSDKEFLKNMKLVSRCLPNVFIPSQLHKVHYDWSTTILDAQFSCLKVLEAQHYRNWKFAITLCGRELPLKTNRYIVEALRNRNNESVINSQPIDMYTLQTRFRRFRRFLYAKDIRIYKSMTYNALSLDFVRYILHNYTMQMLTEWMIENCKTPEEHLYATAYMIAGAPGGFRDQKTSLPTVSKSLWKHENTSHYYVAGEKCSGKSVHQVCILNTADLPLIKEAMSQNTWFFNKYFMEDDHVVMDCVEEQIVRANMQEFFTDYSYL